MLNDFRKTLTKVIHLRSIIGYNGLVFSLKKTPVIGKIIPDRLYSTTALKVIYWIFHVIKEVFVLFIGKILGLGLIYLASLGLMKGYSEFDQAPGISDSLLFASFALTFFLIYALAGIIIRKPVFKCTTEKEYLVFMLRMDARKLNNTLLIYDIAKLVIGYLIAGIVAVIAGAPFWLWLGIPVLAVLIRLMGTGAQAFSYRLKNKRNKPMKENNFIYILKITLILMALPFLLIMVANGYYIELPVLGIIVAVITVLGIWGFFELKRFDSGLHKKALRDNIVRNEVENYKNPDRFKQFKKIKAEGTVKGDKKGFDYLNALFVARHRKMLITKPVVFTAIVVTLMGLIIFGFIYNYYREFGSGNAIHMVLNNLLNLITFKGYEDALMPFSEKSVISFLRHVAENQLLLMLIPTSLFDISYKATQAMYINCDNSLMTYSFFKQPEKIIKLYDIRLKLLIKLNLVPAIVSGLFANLFLFYTGGESYPGQYLVTVLVCVMLSMIQSIIWLALYYLFQPFTMTANVKGGAYMATRIVLSLVALHIFWIPLNSLILAGILAVITVLMLVFMRKLVYKKAPKNWKAKA